MINQMIPRFEPFSTGDFGMVNFVTGEKKSMDRRNDEHDYDEIQIELTKPTPPPSRNKPQKYKS